MFYELKFSFTKLLRKLLELPKPHEKEERQRIYASAELLEAKERARQRFHLPRRVFVKAEKLPVRKVRFGRPFRKPKRRAEP